MQRGATEGEHSVYHLFHTSSRGVPADRHVRVYWLCWLSVGKAGERSASGEKVRAPLRAPPWGTSTNRALASARLSRASTIEHGRTHWRQMDLCCLSDRDTNVVLIATWWGHPRCQAPIGWTAQTPSGRCLTGIKPRGKIIPCRADILEWCVRQWRSAGRCAVSSFSRIKTTRRIVWCVLASDGWLFLTWKLNLCLSKTVCANIATSLSLPDLCVSEPCDARQQVFSKILRTAGPKYSRELSFARRQIGPWPPIFMKDTNSFDKKLKLSPASSARERRALVSKCGGSPSEGLLLVQPK